MEVWKDIEGFEGKYQVSNMGNVRSFSRWKNGNILKPGTNGSGYFYVQLVKDGRKNVIVRVIHRLVAIAFIENPDNLPEVNHIDGNKKNNNVENLEWVSRERNIQHAFDIGLIPRRMGKLRPNAKTVLQKDKNGKIIKIWDSVADIHREKGYSMSSIICCCNKKPKYHTAYGFVWEYKS